MTADDFGWDRDRSERIHAAALARAHPTRIKRDIVTYMEELRQQNSASRAANRARLDRHAARQDADMRRINRLRALQPITDAFPTFAEAGIEEPGVIAWAADVAAGRTTDWLVLLGPTGVGKTWQAVAAYRALVDRLGCDGHAVRALSLLVRAMPGEAERINWHLIEDTDLLLLDDLPGALSEWDRRVLYRVVDTRQATRRLTIVTTNLRRDQVRAELGDQLASRLSAGTRVVAMDGPDRRTTPRT